MYKEDEVIYSQISGDLARERFQAKNIRLLREQQEKERLYREKRLIKQAKHDPEQKDANAKRAYILEAMARAKTRKK